MGQIINVTVKGNQKVIKAFVSKALAEGGITKHSQLTLDDGSNPHNTTKSNVGLSNVPNTDFTTAVGLNTLKTGITTQQATDITTNNAKISDVNHVATSDTDDLTEGSTNLYYTNTRVSANSDVTTNTAKTGVTNEEENTINTELEDGMTGEDLVLNVLSLTTAEYDAGTPVSTTFYIITDV